MGRNKKDKVEDLEVEFRDAIAGMNEEEIRSRLAEISLNQATLMAAKAEDEDLKTKKEIAKEAGAIYREGTKRHKLMVEWCRQVLGDKGKDNGSFEQE